MSPKDTQASKDSEEVTKIVSLNPGGTLSWPVEMLRAWDLEGKPASLYLVLRGQRIIVMTKAEYKAFLAESESN